MYIWTHPSKSLGSLSLHFLSLTLEGLSPYHSFNLLNDCIIDVSLLVSIIYDCLFSKETSLYASHNNHKYKDVFIKEMFNELPLCWPWDHIIELLSGNHKVDGKTYNLTTAKQKELDNFLEENLSTGCIQPSKSQFASTFFFVKKKDEKLHPIQDYQKLNDITVKNQYPLLLISELINKLKNAKYYTKLDIQWGYNNIRMKEGDEWKMVFQTNRGLFKPLVMFFGLCNLPTTFQTMMNHIFCDLINKGKVVIYMDDIMIFTKTLNKHRQII